MTTRNIIATEPPEKKTRRRFSVEIKLKILEEIDQNPETTGLILRNDKLKRENERLKIKLKKAETIIELHKKFYKSWTSNIRERTK